MRALALILLVLLSPIAVAVCPDDLTGTIPNVPNKGLPSSNLCIACRELNQFPQDFNNAAWNFAKFGVGEFTFEYYYETIPGFGSQTRFPVRTCNGLGQCQTTLVLTDFNTIGGTVYGISVPVRISIKNWRLVTTLPSGKTINNPYYPEVNKAKLAVPSTPTGDDGYTPGEDCLNNDGSERAADGRPGSHTGGGGGGGGGEPDTGTPNCGGTCPGHDR